MENVTDLIGIKAAIAALFFLAEAVARLTPSERDNSIVNKVARFTLTVLDVLIPNKSKDPEKRFHLFKKNRP